MQLSGSHGKRAMRAVADDAVGASVVGIYPEKTILNAFAIGSAAAGIAGMLISLETNIEPTMGFSAILKGMIASIIGGIGSIPGAMLGGFFLGYRRESGNLEDSGRMKGYHRLCRPDYFPAL